MAAPDVPHNLGRRARGWLLWSWAFLPGCALGWTGTKKADLVAARQFTLRGMDAVQQEDWKSAEDFFRQAVRASPQDERSHAQYARVLWQRSARQEAIQHMVEAVRLSAGSPELLVELGGMQLAAGDIEPAHASAVQAVRAGRHLPVAHTLLGDVLMRQGRYDEAIESYHLALSLDPYLPAVQVAVADIYRMWGEPRRCLSTLRSLEAEPLPRQLSAQVAYLRGAAQRSLGRSREAVAELSRAVRDNPEPEAYWYELAEAQLESGDPLAARDSAQTALTRNSAHAPSRELLVRLSSTANGLSQQSQVHEPGAVNR